MAIRCASQRRAIQRCGAIITTPILSGLHRRYVRIRFSGTTTENLILIDYVTESPNVNGDDRRCITITCESEFSIQTTDVLVSRRLACD